MSPLGKAQINRVVLTLVRPLPDLPRLADMFRVRRHVSKVPTSDIPGYPLLLELNRRNSDNNRRRRDPKLRRLLHPAERTSDPSGQLLVCWRRLRKPAYRLAAAKA